jgi:hypothetical protein
MSNPTHNQVRLGADGIIYVTAVGAQTYQTVKDVELKVHPLTHKLRSQHKPVYILIELSHGVSQNLSARRAGKEFLTSLDYDRVGMFGAELFLRKVVDFIIAGALHNSTVKNFARKEEALAWLKHGKVG